MSKISSDDDDDPAIAIGIPLFECRLAVDVTLMAIRSLAKRQGTQAFKPKLDELVQLMTDCRQRFELLTERLDAIFALRDGKPH